MFKKFSQRNFGFNINININIKKIFSTHGVINIKRLPVRAYTKSRYTREEPPKTTCVCSIVPSCKHS